MSINEIIDHLKSKNSYSYWRNKALTESKEDIESDIYNYFLELAETDLMQTTTAGFFIDGLQSFDWDSLIKELRA